MSHRLRIFVDVRPPLLADAVAVAVRRDDIEVIVSDDDLTVVHDDSPYDLVVVDDDVRAARPGRVTARISLDSAESLDGVIGLVDWLLQAEPFSPRDATPGDAPGPPQPAGKGPPAW